MPVHAFFISKEAGTIQMNTRLLKLTAVCFPIYFLLYRINETYLLSALLTVVQPCRFFTKAG